MFDKTKAHFRTNRNIYFACGVTAVIVGGITYYLTGKVETKIVTDAWKFQINSPTTNNVVVELIERSTPSRPVGLLAEDGTSFTQVFPSVSEAARQTGHALGRVSKNVNGHISDVNGDVFRPLNIA